MSIQAYQQIGFNKYVISLARLISVAAKGLLLLVCSKLLSDSEITFLAVVLGVANFTVLFSGLDITRHFQHLASIRASRKNVSASIYLHAILATSASFFIVNYYSSEYTIAIFLAIYIVSEAVSQEVGRLCVIVNQQFMIAVINLIKSVPPFIFVLYSYFLETNVLFVYIIYVISFSSLVSLLFSIALLWRLDLRLQKISIKTLIRKLFLATRFGVFFFASTLFVKALVTLDKSFVVSKVGEEIGAAYVIWMACLVVSIPLYEIVIGSWVLSKLYRLHHSEDYEAFVILILQTIFQTTALWVGVLAGSFVCIKLFFSEYDTLNLVSVFSIGCFVLLYLYLQIFGIVNQVVQEKSGQLMSSIAGIGLWLMYLLKTQNLELDILEISSFGCLSLLIAVFIRVYFIKRRIYR